jgi:hypothetical protein
MLPLYCIAGLQNIHIADFYQPEPFTQIDRLLLFSEDSPVK